MSQYAKFPNGCTVGELIRLLQDMLEENKIDENDTVYIQYDWQKYPMIVHDFGYNTYSDYIVLMGE